MTVDRPGSGPVAAATRPEAERSGWRRLLFYGTTRGVSEGLLSLRGLMLAGILTPAGFGAWTLFRIAGRYAALAELGVRRGLEFEIATAHGEPGGHGGEEAGRTALGYILVVYGAIAALALSFVVEDATGRFAMRVFAAAVLVERIWHYELTYLRSTGDLRRFAILEVVNAALQLAVTAALASIWGLPGALLGFVAATSASALLLVRRVPRIPALSGRTLRRLLAVGFPMALTLAGSSVLVTVDRLVVAAYGGTALLGQYAFAAAIAAAASTLAWVVRTVVFPDVYRESRKVGVGTAVRDLFDRTLLPFAFLYPTVLGLTAFGIGPAVGLLFPEYGEAVAPARLFIFVGVATGFSALGSLGIVAASRQRVLPLLAGAAFLLNLGLSVLALQVGAGLAGIAASTLLSRAAYGAVILGLSAGEAGIAGVGRFITGAVAPLVYCVLLVYALGLVFPGSGARDVVASVAVYGVLMLPLVPAFRAWRRGLRRRYH